MTISKTALSTGTMDELASGAAKGADEAIGSTRRVANEALDSLQSNVDRLRESVPNAFKTAAAQVEELTRRGMDRAREASVGVRDRAHQAGDKTVGYIKDEPVKSVLIAAATGAAVALLVGWAMRRRSH
ncbi:hypothetical protein HLB44_14225 [Aquincola sp. S2]|uniref:DUF883 domain-containing protein n=1 Tax=Pseudaquabacterium terrae TaxID=2732868 RepID=A0ABX2EHU6_9BURK|nr:hypothetical protein [Aquabacterium terrae]NRF68146.1 hypothetical protein [Aquabacterium terrae]